ncbi:winged helix-turn-helix domain-containing protein [Methanofollis ethanolicus]|uniref:winged helix-turn-helix domain-containing protein n=1 Tax=Methanofollis ethanolicus TaxID=488124 RepID=UPI00082A55E8|nr:winged helix-turn-helix domain-containing protein [Methanofollis ethanolicus]
MDPVDVVLTKDAFTALASESRLRMLKDLNVRRMTIAELAADLDLAKSTVHHHLRVLVDAGFVAAEDDGHAWVYYALTPEGHALLYPHDGVRIRILLATALVTFVGGIAALAKFLVVLLSDETPGIPMLGGGGAQVQEAPPWDLLILGLALTLIGSVLVGYAYLRWRKRRRIDQDIS